MVKARWFVTVLPMHSGGTSGERTGRYLPIIIIIMIIIIMIIIIIITSLLSSSSLSS